MTAHREWVTQVRCFIGEGHEMFTDADISAASDVTLRPWVAAAWLVRRAADTPPRIASTTCSECGGSGRTLLPSIDERVEGPCDGCGGSGTTPLIASSTGEAD